MHTSRRITYEDRCQMYALHQAGKTQAEIGRALGFIQGTMSRELSRNKGPRGYRFQQAPRNAPSRQEQVRHRPRNLTRRIRRAIARTLRAERGSPEPISCWLQAERGAPLSPEQAGDDLWRWRGTHENRRGVEHAGRSVIPSRIDIAEGPAIVAAKARRGDWEGDTIVGARHNGARLTHC